MKKILLLLLMLWGVAHAQSIGRFRYDSTIFERVGGNNEVIIKNASRNIIGGVLTNMGGGRVEFVTPSGGTGGGVDTLYRKPGKDSIYWKKNNIEYRIKDSTGGASGQFVTIRARGTSAAERLLNFPTGDTIIESKAAKVGWGLTRTAEGDTALRDNIDSLQVTSRDRARQLKDSLSALINLRLLKSDTASMLAGYPRRGELKDTAANIRGDLIIVDTAHWNDADTTMAVHVGGWPGVGFIPIVHGGGGSTYTPPTRLRMVPGHTPGAVVPGDSLITQSDFTGKFPKVFRNGWLQDWNSNAPGGYQFSTSTVTLHPPVEDGEVIDIDIYSDEPDSISAASSAGLWVDVSFASATNITDVSHVYQATGTTAFDAFAVMNETLVADGGVILQHKTDAQSYLAGVKTSSTPGDYTTYSAGLYVVSGGALWQVTAGSPSTISYTLSNNEWVGLFRVGSAWTLQTSTDKTTWTTRHTFSGYTSTATQYLHLNEYSQPPIGKAYNMQVKND